jgi:hypothetical protein
MKGQTMQTDCTPSLFSFQDLGEKKVVGNFDGGTISSDAGALILRELEHATGFIKAFADCFTDYREPGYIEHSVKELLSQRVFGICLGYEDLNDHDQLRKDPVLAAVCGKLDVSGENRRQSRDKGNALAGKSTLNRLETSGGVSLFPQRYKKITVNQTMVEMFLVNAFLDSFGQPPEEIVLDLDATDDPIHGEQEGRFFHGYYDCYCYLPLYIFCGDQLLCAKLRPSNIDASAGSEVELARIVAQIRERWPEVRITARADSGFCRESIMSWCEANEVDFLFGIAKNQRLLRKIRKELSESRRQCISTGLPQRRYAELMYRTKKTWSRSRRVVAKAEYLLKGENPRFVVTSLPQDRFAAQALYEELYCARGDMENRIKEQQLFLFADRTSSATMRANQLRLWFSSVAYLIMSALRRIALKGTELATAQCDTIRLKVLKIGAQVRLSVRRIYISFASGYPYQELFRQAHLLQFDAVWK